MRVLVLGAGGQLGRAVVESLLRRNLSVAVFLRNPSFSQVPQHVAAFGGDARNENDVLRALTATNLDAVVNVISAGTLKENTVESDATAAILKALRRTPIKRYVGMSAAMVAADLLIMKLLRATLFRYVFREDQRVEELIRATDLDWTIVRPPRLTNKPRKGFRVSASAPPHAVSVSRVDVADFIASAIAERSYVRQAVFVY